MIAFTLQAPAAAAAAAADGDWQAYLYATLASLVVGALGWLSKLASAWVQARIERVKNESLRERLQVAHDQAEVVVAMVNQTMRPRVIEAAADGKITAEEAEKLLAVGRGELKARMGPDWWRSLMGELGVENGGLDGWLDTLIEASIFRAKGSAAAPGPLGSGSASSEGSPAGDSGPRFPAPRATPPDAG